MIYDSEEVTLAFDGYRENSNVDHLSDSQLSTISAVLRKKLIKDTLLNAFREDCQREIRARLAKEKRHNRIRDELVPAFKNKLEYAFDITNFLHIKVIQKLRNKESYTDIEDYIRDAGRTIGSKLYDLPSMQTGLYSTDALKKISDAQSASDKLADVTNEHFFSLYANAGPFILRKAILKTVDDTSDGFVIKEFVRMISHLNQTIKTTKAENLRLMKYHSFNPLITVQDSYEQANISELVDCGFDDTTDVHLKWFYLCAEYGLQLKVDAGRHFSVVHTYDEAEQLFPEIRGSYEYVSNK